MRTIALIILLLFVSKSFAEEPVYFADVSLKRAVESKLAIAGYRGTEPTPTDMLLLKKLSMIGIQDITGLEYAKNLEDLSLFNGLITDISPLAGLTNLKKLSLSSNRIRDISPLAGFTNLAELSLEHNPLDFESYSKHLPQIKANNPGITLWHAPKPLYVWICIASLLLAILGFFSLFIGFKVVWSKGPIFMPDRLWSAVVVLSPVMLLFQIQQLQQYYPKLEDIQFTAILFIGLLVFSWFLTKGYKAIGISGDSFIQATRYSLNKSNLPFEEVACCPNEKSTVFNLTSINAKLQTSNRSWFGSAKIKLKKTKDAELMSNIVMGIKEYYIENNIGTNKITFIDHMIFGVLWLAIGTYSWPFDLRGIFSLT